MSVCAQVQGKVWFYGAVSRYTSSLGNVEEGTRVSAILVYPAQGRWEYSRCCPEELVSSRVTLGRYDVSLVGLVIGRPRVHR